MNKTPMHLILCAAIVLAPGLAHAGTITFFEDQAAFLDATDSLEMTVEDFEGGIELTNSEHWSACFEPVTDESDDPCFRPGDMADGFAITSGEKLAGVVLMSPDVWDSGSHVIGAWPFQVSPSSFNPTVVDFDDGPTAVGTDVFGVRLAPGIPTGDPEPVLVEVFDRADNLLDSLLVEPEQYDEPAFIGMLSSVPIGRVTFATQLDSSEDHAGEMIDNLHFGGGPGRLEVSAAEFGAVAVGDERVVDVTLTHAGDLDATVESISGADAPFFVQSDTCSGQTLSSGDVCTLEVGFAPAISRTVADELAIALAEPSAGQTLALAGDGIGPRIQAAPARIDFGTVAVDTDSPPLEVSISNPRSADLRLTDATLADPAFAIVGGTCGALPVDLSPDDACTLEIAFSPTHPGPVAGAAVLVAAGQTASTSIAVRGEGVQP